jgi:transposase InsO family protein
MLTITMTFARCHRRYGSPRIHRALRGSGLRVGTIRVARLMRVAGLQARRRQRFVTTTDNAHAWPIVDNLVARQLAVGGTVHAVWESDATFSFKRATAGCISRSCSIWRHAFSSDGPRVRLMTRRWS